MLGESGKGADQFGRKNDAEAGTLLHSREIGERPL